MKIGKEQCNKSTLENAWDEGLTISLCHLNVIYNTAGWDYDPKASRHGPVRGEGEGEGEREWCGPCGKEWERGGDRIRWPAP